MVFLESNKRTARIRIPFTPQRMKTRRPIALFFVSLGLAAVSADRAAAGEPIPALAKSGEVVELSPFVVGADTDVGYSASQSVLGGRFKQEIKDIPSQIEVFTAEMMADFKITSLSDAFRYSANVENLEEYVSPSDGGAAFWSGKETGRIRGIQPASFSTSRNLFSSITRTDAYNADRFEIGSGAQSLIFSLGEPSGVANVKLRNAEYRNLGSTSLTVDSEDGYRFTLDLNRKLGDKLAFRLDYLNENRPSFIKPSFDRSRRGYGTLTAKPLRHTTVRLHAEFTEEKANRPPTQLPFDFATPAYSAIKAGNVTTVASATFGAVANSAMFPVGNNANPQAFFHAFSTQLPTGPGAIAFDPARYGPAARDPNSGVTRVTFSPQNIHLFPEVAAMVGRNFLGDGVRNEFRSKIFDAFVEQRLLRTLSLEVGGHWEEWNRLQQSYVGYTNFGYNADVNRITLRVPWTTTRNVDTRVVPTPLPAEYVLNPNFGRLFTVGVPSGAKNQEKTKEVRASLAWEPVTLAALKWLGQHSFFGSYNYRDSFVKAQTVQVRMLGNLQYQNFNGVLNDARRVFLYAHYFDAGANRTAQPPVIGGSVRSLEELLAGGTKFTEPTTGQLIELSGWNSPYGGSLPSGSTTQLGSAILAWQGKLLRDRLLFSYGLRDDAVASKSMNVITEANRGPNQRNGGWEFIDSPTFVDWNDATRVSYRANSHTYGAVVRPLHWLSLSYYQSATFNLPTGQFRSFGEPIPGTNGASKEYALRFDLPDGKGFLKLDRYELDRIGSNVGFGTVRIEAGRMETSYRKVVDDLANARGTPRYATLVSQQGLTNPNAWTADASLNSAFHPITGDTIARGYELTAGNRLGNLDVRLTFAKAETVQGNVSKDWENWVKDRLPVWSDPNLTDLAGNRGWDRIPYQGDSANNYTIRGANGTLRQMSMKEFYDSVTQSALNAALQLNSKPVDAGRKYRANLNAAYDFKQGALKGVRVGGALRWRSAPIIGFPAVPSGIVSGGFPVPQIDLDHPYHGKEEINADAFLAYSGKVSDRLRYRVQLNVRNLLTGKNSFLSTHVNAFGESIFTVIETPRSYALSLDLMF